MSNRSLFLNLFPRTLDLGRFAGPIFAIILVVDCLFFMFLEWLMPEHDFDKVQMHWEQGRFAEVRLGDFAAFHVHLHLRSITYSSPKNMKMICNQRKGSSRRGVCSVSHSSHLSPTNHRRISTP